MLGEEGCYISARECSKELKFSSSSEIPVLYKCAEFVQMLRKSFLGQGKNVCESRTG